MKMEAASSSSSMYHYSPSVQSLPAATHNATVSSSTSTSPSLDPSENPPLRLKLNITQELINQIENVINPCPPQQHKPSDEKNKALNFPISRITIGQWTRTSLNPNDLRAKFYFARKKLLWQFLDDVETEEGVERLYRKIEMNWDIVLSLRTSFYSHDETEILEVELSKCPKFFIENNQRPGKLTQWKELDQDFTQDQSASKCRRHTLHFAPGELQENLGKLVSHDRFWSKLVNVTFPTLPRSLYFDIGYGDSNNLSCYSHGQTLSSNVNNDLLYNPPQGFDHLPVGEVNFDMETLFCPNNDARPMNPFVQDSHQNSYVNELLGNQAIQPSSQLIIDPFNMGRQLSQMKDRWELRGSQALHGTQTTSVMFQHMNEEDSTYLQDSPYLLGVIAEQEDRQNMERTNLDANFQTNNVCFNPNRDQCANMF